MSPELKPAVDEVYAVITTIIKILKVMNRMQDINTTSVVGGEDAVCLGKPSAVLHCFRKASLVRCMLWW